MKYLVVIMSFLMMSCITYAEGPSQEKYRSHRVKQGETVYSLSKKYGLSERAIYRLNPDAKKGIGEGSIIILPAEEIVLSGSSEVKFKKHRVKRKETLFSISQKYGVTVDDLKKYNKHLYSKGLKKGEKLQIPIVESTSSTVVISSQTGSNPSNESESIHIIKPKETKYGIARKYGMTIAELEKLNPDVPSNFPIGTQLKVAEAAVIESATIEEEDFSFYEVLAKEGFYRLKVKLGLSEEEIITLNPYAKDGLKQGMILKIPKAIATTIASKANTINLENSITNTNTKHLAVLLPFQLKKATDSTSNEELIKRNRAVRVSLDFYSGVMMAAEFAKDKGISLQLDVYDTEANIDRVSSIISNNDFSNVDAVVGPLLSKNVEKTASLLKSDNIAVFSPLNNRNIKMTSNLFQTLPSDELLESAMIQYLQEHSTNKSLLLISDKTKTKQKANILAALPGTMVLSPREKGFLYVVDIQNKMKANMENWVILESTDPVIISNVVGLLNGMPEEFKIRLFTTDKNGTYDYDDISNVHLAHLNFTFPSISRSYDYKNKEAFIVSYKNKYGVYPNRFAVRGFDVTYDVILRLAAEGNVYDASDSDFVTEYVENKFRYEKKIFSGYTNNALYILKYNDDLRFEVVE